MYLVRAFAVWFLIIFVETAHGALRQIFLAPAVGDFPARRIAFFVGLLLIFAIAYFTIRWVNAPSAKSLLLVGLIWAILTLSFEFALGFLILGYPRERVFEDYDFTRGGLMGFGILFIVFAPALAAKSRVIKTQNAVSF